MRGTLAGCDAVLGVGGIGTTPDEVNAAIASLKEGVSALGFRWSDPAQPSP